MLHSVRNAIACWAVLSLMLGCAHAQAPQPQSLPKHRVIIERASGAPLTLLLEKAQTKEQEEMGLMYRSQLAEDGGMVFDFPTCGAHAMWMKNTYVSLDMIFVDCSGKIAAIVEGTTPQSLEVIRPASQVSNVIELKAGQAKVYGLQLGDSVMVEQGVMP